MSPQRAQTNQYIQLYQQQKIDFENNQVSLNYKLKLPKSRRPIFLPVALKDPTNKFFARQSRHRLSAEMIRDNALAVSDLLVNDYGGSSIKPYQPKGYYRHLNFPKREYVQHQDDRRYKRSVYMHWQRQFLHPLLKAMDAPSREECVAKRSRSNTPIAAIPTTKPKPLNP